jgi:hypothetical protein
MTLIALVFLWGTFANRINSTGVAASSVEPVRFGVLLDGKAPGDDHGFDTGVTAYAFTFG